MEQFIQKLDTLLDNDPFADLDGNFLSTNDLELLEKYRVKYLEDRQRIRNERQTKSFEQIMEDLVQELSTKPDLSSFYRTLDEPLGTTGKLSNQFASTCHHDVQPTNYDTSADEQDDLDHCPTIIDPTKSIGRSVTTDELQTSTRVVYPLSKSPTIPPARKLSRYADQPRRNTYTLENESSSSSTSSLPSSHLVNNHRPPEYVRLDSEGFDPQQSDHLLHHIKDARSTFSIPKPSQRLTRQEAQSILQRKLGAFIKGHLTRQLFRTDHVKRLLQTLHDTKKFAVEFQTQCFQTKTKLEPEDIRTIDQLIQQVEAVLNEIHSIFTQYSPSRRVAMIRRQTQTHQIQTARVHSIIDFLRLIDHCLVHLQMHQRMTKVIHRPIIDPSPPTTDTIQSRPTTSNQQRSEPAAVRRHVTSVRPVTKTASVQRKSRPKAQTNLPVRSSSATIRPPPRLAPSSPLFRNRPK